MPRAELPSPDGAGSVDQFDLALPSDDADDLVALRHEVVLLCVGLKSVARSNHERVQECAGVGFGCLADVGVAT